MATQLKLRRDTYANLQLATPVEAEPGVDTDNWRLVVGDGATAGGVPHVNYRDAQNCTFTYAGTAGGTGNAITISLLPAIASYTAGQAFRFKASAANTGSATVNVNGKGAVTIKKKSGTAFVNLEADDIIVDQDVLILYDGTYFQLVSGAGSGGLVIVRTIYTSSTTWNKNANLLYAEIECQSAAGGTARGNSPGNVQGPAGSGAYARKVLSAGSLGSSETVTIGATGSTPNTQPSDGGNASTTSFGSHVSCTGGTGGKHSGSSGRGTGGVATGGDVNIDGATSISAGENSANLTRGLDSQLGRGGYGKGGGGDGIGGPATGYGASAGASVGSGSVSAATPTGAVIIVTEYRRA